MTDLVDAAKRAQILIEAKRHIFSANTAHCVRCGRLLVDLMAQEGGLDKPCEGVRRRQLGPQPWGN